MKKLTSLILFVLIVGIGQSQTVDPTTDDEYKFITKGYNSLKSQGLLDTKHGYTYTDIQSNSTSVRKVNIIALTREGESSPCGFIVKYKREGSNASWLCIPTSDAPEYMWTALWKSLNEAGSSNEDKLHLISYTFAKAIGRYAEK